jgi:2-C-methyl-D-erythritol 4-phosphate cytidylyltransferase
MKYYAIIVGGGSGSRMQNSVAKQFLLLNDKPILMHTIEAFQRCVLNPKILLVLNSNQHNYWKVLCSTYQFNIPHEIVEGGPQRFDSVKNGLAHIHSEGMVAVHDAVRPLVSPELILTSYKIAEEKGNAVTGVHPTDSVRKLFEDQNSEMMDRDAVVLIQTPQTFSVSVLKKAYEEPYRNEFTDDASVVEHAGFKINLITGERTNLKITYPEDLEIASLLLNKKGL